MRLVIMQQEFATRAEADTWLGTLPRTESWTKEGDTDATSITWTSGKVDDYPADGGGRVYVAELRADEAAQ